MSTIKIDDVEYNFDSLSDAAKANIASLQFVRNELQKALPVGATNVTSVQISGDFARSIVYTDPTEINGFTLPTLESQVRRTFNLTAAKGSAITLPNGEVVEKAFRGIAASQAEFISREITF